MKFAKNANKEVEDWKCVSVGLLSDADCTRDRAHCNVHGNCAGIFLIKHRL